MHKGLPLEADEVTSNLLPTLALSRGRVAITALTGAHSGAGR